MMVDNLFAAWWLIFGSKFEEKLGFSPTEKEVARYAFETGVKEGPMNQMLQPSRTELVLENGAQSLLLIAPMVY